ncbi:3-dehydroquinate dehydratase [Ammoniphilus oxalaticus]|uniref:3-dehydroquinate dehydratase n=1 Tax=Ammoniphilus oxalaticus TaxID=66863 RepID=A0A419SFT6_9BACL|nr:type I 3-dehydroquinate dehydratase [Ammoniphilus oxalaticus]RKD22648.1 3-dehydroquinate dehydratase [Ammoniphilus oxalaticus]
MTRTKAVNVRGTEIGSGQPIICIPLISQSVDQLVKECKQAVSKKPDMIEWRADFFSELANLESVIVAARMIRGEVGEIPLLFTIRSIHEGGQPVERSEEEIVNLINAICRTGYIDLVDYEIRNDQQRIEGVLATAKQAGVYVVLSYHNFEKTPESSILIDKLRQAEQLGADMAKIAVMPQSNADVLQLLQAAQTTQEELSIPLIAISMGGLGAITRVAGWMFGSAVTFAIGNEESAPGQIPIADLRAMITQLQNASN